MGVISRKLSTFATMDPARRALMAEAAFWLAYARLALLLLPFRQVAKGLGTLGRPTEDTAPPGSDADLQLARDIGWAVARTAGYVPFKALCLQQAIAARIMLRRRGVQSVLHFGVAPARSPADRLESHAWLDAGGAKVTGYPVEPRYTEVACFR